MKRSGLVLLAMVAGISLVLWAGWHNLRERRRVLQEKEESHAMLMPDAAGAPAGSDASAGGTSASADVLGKSAELRNHPAPAFALMDLDGKTVSLNDYKGHPVLVNFWGTYCAPCKIEMPWLEEFSKKYAGDGLQVLGITYDVEVGKDKIAKEAKKLGVTYPILMSDKKIEGTYLKDSEALPISFYVDRSGKVTDIEAGLGTKDELEARVKAVLK